MFHSVKAHADDSHVLVFTGQPADMAEMYEATDGDDISFWVGGLLVSRVAPARHSGKPAVNFTLAEGVSAQEVGRLVVLVDATRDPDALFTWEVFYTSADAATENLAIWSARKTMPEYTTVPGLDYAFEGESLDEAVMREAADWGVIITVKNPWGPGGGWPIVDVSGKSEKVEAFLRGAYGLEGDELKECLPWL